MNDNKNYMADITNSDEGSIGSGGELFLKGISGSVSDGYQVTIQGQNVRYTYDEDTEENFSNEDLTLSGTDYIYETQHSYGDWIIMNEPSCTVPGLRQRVCSNCGDVDTEEIPAKGHTWNTDYTVDQAPTCAEEGSESIHCADCDAVKENSARSIPKTEHEYGSWEVTKEATCTEKGSRKKVCGNCGDIITEEIPAKGHTWNTDYTVDQAATCAEEGSESIHCTDCDAVKEDSARSIPKTKHEHGSWEVTKESTCTEEGSRERVCKNCGSKDIQVISKKPGIELTADAVTGIVNKTYTGKALPQSLVVTVNGKNLKEGTDYKVTYKNNTNAGTASVSVTGLGTYCKTVTKTFKINPKKVTPAVTLSRTAYTCTGKAQKPAVTVKIGSAKLTSAGYQVTWPSGRINVGTYKVTVKLEGNYSGSKSVSYKINPKGTALSGLTAVKAGFKAKWKKQAAQTTGYQLQFSVSGSFPSNRQKTLIISGCGTVTKKVTKLQKKKKYFVRIRTYKKIGKTTYYSTWSGKKSITTK
jgi:ribosomal protein L32